MQAPILFTSVTSGWLYHLSHSPQPTAHSLSSPGPTRRQHEAAGTNPTILVLILRLPHSNHKSEQNLHSNPRHFSKPFCLYVDLAHLTLFQPHSSTRRIALGASGRRMARCIFIAHAHALQHVASVTLDVVTRNFRRKE